MKKQARIRDSREALKKIDKMKKLIASASRKCDEIPDLIRPVLDPWNDSHKRIKDDADELDLDISVKLAEMMIIVKELEKFVG